MGILDRLFGGHHGGGHHGGRRQGGHHDGYRDDDYRQPYGGGTGLPPSTPPAGAQQVACPACQVSNPASARFCQQCGASLAPRACTQCGVALGAGAKFCAGCGKPAA